MVTVEFDRLSSPQSRMPPPLSPWPCSIVTPVMSATVPGSSFITLVVGVPPPFVASMMVLLWPPPTIVTVLPPPTSSCPMPESTL